MPVFFITIASFAAAAPALLWLDHSLLASLALYCSLSGLVGLALGRIFLHRPMITGPFVERRRIEAAESSALTWHDAKKPSHTRLPRDASR